MVGEAKQATINVQNYLAEVILYLEACNLFDVR